MTSRRSFLGALGLGAAGAALSPVLRRRRAWAGGGELAAKRVVVVGIAGGVRLSESLGMAEGATMPNLLGTVPLIEGFGDTDAGPPRVAPEYAAMAPPIIAPPPLAQPLYTQGTLVTNLRYAEGAPGHLQGHACLVSGYYNNIENRADARLPVPTLFELHRRQNNAPATDAWYVSVLGGFYRALQSSDHPGFGARFGGAFLAPPGVMSPLVPIVTSGVRELELQNVTGLPVVPFDRDEDAAVARLTGVLDGNTGPFGTDSAIVRASAADNDAVREHLAGFYSDATYASYFPDSFGIGIDDGEGGLRETGDALTVYHCEQLLARFKPSITVMTLLDIDAAHTDFNGYLRGQVIADACVRHLWEFIQSTDGLRDETALLVLPEHGRHLFFNGQNPDTLGRSGLDHGQGDDGDRDVFLLALGPDFKAGEVIAPTGVTQSGRTSGRYETIDALATAATILGYGDLMRESHEDVGARPGLVIEDILR